MSDNLQDFDVAPDPPKAPEPLPEQPVMIAGHRATHDEVQMLKVEHALQTFVNDYIPLLNDDQMHVLISALPARAAEGAGGGYDASFSLANEISMQIQAVNGLRDYMFPNGKLRDKATTREAKEVLTTVGVMIKTLMENHEKVMNMERMRSVEAATIEVLQEMGDAQKEKFLVALQRRLEGIS